MVTVGVVRQRAERGGSESEHGVVVMARRRKGSWPRCCPRVG
jgi:hypothetical protein